ncbi:hypothetical protein GcC1_009024 [Golovinomyces cichoracearum]|uniref:Uncharacterized protein n=1 Tax=Golovinomyces cichoracearum TaxID=62708 RepID=A0A420J7Z1_9PEZI|nr:hypothetical protein GcC1_009024 [Golovinomyces cichoracearum]
MATLIHCFSYPQNHDKLESKNGSSAPFLFPSCCRIMMSPSVRSDPDRFDQEYSDDSTQHRRPEKRRMRSSSLKKSRDKRVEIRGKRRANRDSIFSFLSLISKNDDARSLERKNREKKEDSSGLYAQNFYASSSTLNCTIKKPCQDLRISAFGGSSVSAAPSWGHVIPTAYLSDNQSDMSEHKYLRRGGIQDEICRPRDDATTSCDFMSGSNRKHLNFFQEQQEQEYRIAKAWLEAQECSKASLHTFHNTSAGPEFGEKEKTLDISSSNGCDDRLICRCSGKGGSRENASSRISRPKSEAAANFNLNFNHTFSPKSKSLVDGKEGNTAKHKRIPGLAGLAMGVKDWLCRRTTHKKHNTCKTCL